MDIQIRSEPTWSRDQVGEAIALLEHILALGEGAYTEHPGSWTGEDGVLNVSFHNHDYDEAVQRLKGLSYSVAGFKTWDVRFPEDGPDIENLRTYPSDFGDPERLARSSVDQIWRYFAYLTRSEYWNSGGYAEAIQNGRLAAALARLRDLQPA